MERDPAGRPGTQRGHGASRPRHGNADAPAGVAGVRPTSPVGEKANETDYVVSWRVSDASRGDGWLVRTEICSGGAEARELALAIVPDAHGGEVRVRRRVAGRETSSAFSSVYEIARWRPEGESLPDGVDSAWQIFERRRDRAVLIYNRLRRALSEAAAADLIGRGRCRELRLVLRSILIDGSGRSYERPPG
jgi:hypothetical protein